MSRPPCTRVSHTTYPWKGNGPSTCTGATWPTRSGARAAPACLLSPREAEVLRLVAQGRSNSEIADELVISVETVKTHVGTVLAKLEARDRTNAAVLAWRSGFVP
ncbi:response regulator transcription factor [Nocardioides sp. CER19]|uniref:response regulator transcription factor n=1 Tax=Nocardioides sp. CER19 TaxID=3038538 RepID=UPI00244CBC24|nr:response regulator transcription factor [Nocardioides sp. CER19]MDH2413851.1 response regulator transcription factor [Nocardioides sp. CER19]